MFKYTYHRRHFIYLDAPKHQFLTKMIHVDVFDIKQNVEPSLGQRMTAVNFLLLKNHWMCDQYGLRLIFRLAQRQKFRFSVIHARTFQFSVCVFFFSLVGSQHGQINNTTKRFILTSVSPIASQTTPLCLSTIGQQSVKQNVCSTDLQPTKATNL